MEELYEYTSSLDSALENELGELSQSSRQHHSDWDNHIITLSTLSLGFIFTFLPLASGEKTYLIAISSCCFILSIISATTNYIFAEKSHDIALHSISARQRLNRANKISYMKFKKEKTKAENNSDEKAFEKAKTSCAAEIDKNFNDASLDTLLIDLKNNNKKIQSLNLLKTLFFIVGIIITVAFSLTNFELLAK